MAFFTLAENFVASNILTMSRYGSTHTGASSCKVAIYRVDNLEAYPAAMTCIARSAHNSSRWNNDVLDIAPIVDNGAATPSAISSVTLVANQLYAVGLMTVGHSGTPLINCLGTFRVPALKPNLGFFGGEGYSDMPVNLNGGFYEAWAHPWVALT